MFETLVIIRTIIRSCTPEIIIANLMVAHQKFDSLDPYFVQVRIEFHCHQYLQH